ncbi:hypothetical protein BEWA_013560 [Theileria equi strain WA]|uniref:Signal peptide containing protein n=1 Tax=Theileria equi strain WA TaxID=1537102 RepID=L1LBK7_THEEQ|nr:hypothetical protein BEWA_013560 [Theileria equi strain WA]EKX72797.1 hypothetical protein BEWA_013560 [Theileria equi strain WA]|eukprot:XP_004832249.1 hypothetical protein BEWA_013560 [Theileria equi strain WA]
MTKVNLVTDCKNGIKTKRYTPKDGVLISSVVDGDKELWKKAEGADEKCTGVRSYKKGNASFLYITIKKGDKLEPKLFEKVNGTWREVSKDEFNDKVDEMLGIPAGSATDISKSNLSIIPPGSV